MLRGDKPPPMGGFGGGGAGAGRSSVRDNNCWKCGEPGHISRECTNNNASTEPRANFNGPAPGPGLGDSSSIRGRQPVTYVPVDLKLDQLWSQHIGPGQNFERFYGINVQVSGGDTTCIPLASFEDAGLTPLLLDNVKKCGYDKPMPIQQHAIPYIMAGRDLMGCAQTGSGKTAAFLLPILSSILKHGDMSTAFRPVPEPAAIIISPTRELAMQIKDEGRKFAAGTQAEVSVIYGGTNVGVQCDKLKSGCSVLVATPGRLMHFIDEGRISLRKCRFVVLDEADRMLDMNFEHTIRRLMELPEMPPKGTDRQTLMFSATFRPEIQQLAQDFLSRQVFVTIGKVGAANEDVVQRILLVPGGKDKYDQLYTLLLEDLQLAADAGAETVTKTLVFVERRRVADFLASRLSQMGLPTTSIHGDREQREREEALRDFKTGRCPILVATAVAARGLDIVGVDHVVNFDLPSTAEDYVHRIGRTGRVGNPGRATSFYDAKTDKMLAPNLLQLLRDAQQEVPAWLFQEAGVDANAPALPTVTGGDTGANADAELW